MNNSQRIARAIAAGVGEFYIRDQQLPSCRTFCLPEKFSEINLRSAFICGPVGTGKTWALCCLACDALSAGYSVQMINFQWLQLEVRDTYKQSATETERSVLRRYIEPDILCLDDLGAGKEIEGRESEAARILLYTLIDQRYYHAKQTFISGNLDPRSLAKRYDERIARRIREMSRVIVLKNPIKPILRSKSCQVI